MILIQSMQVDTAVASAYANNTGGAVIIDKLGAFNNDSVSRSLTVHLVPFGGVADATNKLDVIAIAAGVADRCHNIVGFDLGPGDSIWLQASVAGMITVRASGRIR